MSGGSVAAIAGTSPLDSSAGPGGADVDVGPADPPSPRPPQKCHAPNTTAAASSTAAPRIIRVRVESPRPEPCLTRPAECLPERPVVRTGTLNAWRAAAA